MSTFWVTSFAVSVSMVLSGCGAPAFRDSFSGYQDMTVARLLQSEPTATDASEIAMYWRIVKAPATVHTATTQKPVRIGGQAVVQTVNHQVPDRYRVTWTGLRSSHAADPTVIQLRDAAGHRALELRLEGERLRVITETEDPFPELTYDKNKSHEVTLILNMTSRPTVEIEITEEGQPLYSTPPVPMMDLGFRGLSEIDFAVSSGRVAYYIDALTVAPHL